MFLTRDILQRRTFSVFLQQVCFFFLIYLVQTGEEYGWNGEK